MSHLLLNLSTALNVGTEFSVLELPFDSFHSFLLSPEILHLII